MIVDGNEIGSRQAFIQSFLYCGCLTVIGRIIIPAIMRYFEFYDHGDGNKWTKEGDSRCSLPDFSSEMHT